MMYKYLLIAAVILILTGCAIGTKTTDPCQLDGNHSPVPIIKVYQD